MFQYTHETILNNVDGVEVLERPLTNPYTLVDGVKRLVIKRAGEYYSDCIVKNAEGAPVVYKTAAVEGKPGTLDLANVKAALTEPGEYHFIFRVITPNQFYAEYASPNWQVFGKPMVIGFTVPKNAEGKAEADEGFKNLIEGIRLAVPVDNQFITVSDAGLITGTSNYMAFDKALLERYDPTMCDSCQGSYVKVDVKYGYGANVEDFATKNWIIENLRFPTYPNIRYASANDEMPTAEKYTEFVFTYSVPRVGLGGLSGVGQGLTATTRHIFYVPEGAAADAFTAELEKLGCVFVTKNVADITVGGDDPKTEDVEETTVTEKIEKEE